MAVFQNKTSERYNINIKNIRINISNTSVVLPAKA